MTKRNECLYLVTLFMAFYILSMAVLAADTASTKRLEPIPSPSVNICLPVTEPVVAEPAPKPSEEPQPSPEPEWVCPLTDEEVELIALLTMTEAEGEPEEGQRLVIDTVLNRVDSPYFPDTVYEVVYQKNQYSGIQGERVERCWVKEELCELVRDEAKERTNDEVVFFRTEHYHSFGVPMFQVGHHYFSKYE